MAEHTKEFRNHPNNTATIQQSRNGEYTFAIQIFCNNRAETTRLRHKVVTSLNACASIPNPEAIPGMVKALQSQQRVSEEILNELHSEIELGAGGILSIENRLDICRRLIKDALKEAGIK